ncbi:hypothetical protein BAUCODRAFT_127370 [Baudoinia panamericana UAMH 10762]|uniref:PNPLA domain-containing protein n=1 Tax=Baudoinia panamericana (strain UAMH 10762) TaxID=717646 RepID=M2MYT9_BAUPA|nr:uncharacterized protein BAUCODRAFT_127370 [Baudoinia panamericana UAMH 10762]EMC91470.1 hypothetical protein BAUCODRAFT_127370 [Baudoinia panamericana UAMH 10762]
MKNTVPDVIPPGPRLPQLRKNGARLLACDGGGVKGVSSVLILDAIMEKVKQIEVHEGINLSPKPRKPCDYFDLAAGTSTGGLIALMLFRLRMNTKQCLDEYHNLASQIFAPTIFGFRTMGGLLGKCGLMLNMIASGAQFPRKPLEDAIRTVVDKYSDRDDQWKDYLVNPKSAMMFMCATVKDEGESVLLRSYTRPEGAAPVRSPVVDENDLVNSIKIVPAARATSAAPGYLPEEVWQYNNQTISFWDGGVLNNNPIEQLWNARYDLVERHQPPPAVSIVLSLGCGRPDVRHPRFIGKLMNMAIYYAQWFVANTAAKHADFERLANRMVDRGDQNSHLKYYRLDCPTGKAILDMADYTIMDDLEATTRKYIETDPDAIRMIDECARLLASRD